MKSIFSYIFILGLVLFSLTVHGQNVSEDFEKIRQEYSKNKSLSLQLTYKLFSSNANTPVEVQTGVFRKKDNLVHASCFGTEMIHGQSANCMVNHKNKEIYISPVASNATKQFDYNPEDIQKYVKNASSTSYEKTNESLAKYTFTYKKMAYGKVEVEFNPKTFRLVRLIYYFKGKFELGSGKVPGNARLEISFTNMKKNPVFGPAEFAISKYVMKKNNKYLAVKAYKGYKVFSVK